MTNEKRFRQNGYDLSRHWIERAGSARVATVRAASLRHYDLLWREWLQITAEVNRDLPILNHLATKLAVRELLTEFNEAPMTARIARDPSPVRSALLHGSLGFMAFAAVFGLGGAAIHFGGDADAASPSLRMALFENDGAIVPDLNPRLPGDSDAALAMMASVEGGAIAANNNAGQPDLGADLGVEYGVAAQRPGAANTAPSHGVRINGQTVMPGQSLSQVQAGHTPDMAPPPAPVQVASAAPVAPQAAAPKTVFERNARAFENTAGKPTVSIVVGGLGINRGRTQAVIDELPPEVTLSFAPTTIGLQTWIRKARRAGHEVLIELPMEPYDYGRERPHPQILQVAAGSEANTRRLSTLLSRVNGYAGVMNYQGGKFATSAEAAGPVFDLLETRGLAFFEDGSLSRSVFETTAAREGVTFGKAGAWIDARPEADEIMTQLMMLEAQALETGTSLGVGLSYPVTVDILKEWTGRLEAKGLVLAPASHFAKQTVPAGQIRVAALEPQG